MARTEALLPAGTRNTDYISFGVVARFFPRDKVDAVWGVRDEPAFASATFRRRLSSITHRVVFQDVFRDTRGRFRAPLKAKRY